MQALQHILFESPLILFVGSALILAILGAFWWARPGKVTSWAFVCGMALAALLMILQHVIVTDRERILERLEEIALAIDCEEIETIGRALADDCKIDGMAKAELLDRLAFIFNRAEIDEVTIMEAEVSVEGDVALANVRGHCRYKAPDFPYDYHISSWDVRFVRRGGDWLIQEVRHSDRQGISAQELLNIATH
ncbi:MAG: hypothetical protein JXQ73_04700 [Phycisphaerae bacterium]|nr:hypothetical protein [Phycisphaerae bacterium]